MISWKGCVAIRNPFRVHCSLELLKVPGLREPRAGIRNTLGIHLRSAGGDRRNEFCPATCEQRPIALDPLPLSFIIRQAEIRLLKLHLF